MGIAIGMPGDLYHLQNKYKPQDKRAWIKHHSGQEKIEIDEIEISPEQKATENSVR